MDADDLEPRHTPPKPRLLDDMSVAALRIYIAELNAELARVEGEISKRLDQHGRATELFKS